MQDGSFEKTADQTAAFQKIWVESASKMMQAAFTTGPNSPPPELMRQIRSGIFQALAESWEEFMRSPQFIEGMRQWMENAITFRKMSNEFMAKVRNDIQAPSREDIDTIMLNIHHMEKRLLDKVDDLCDGLRGLSQRVESFEKSRPTTATSGSKKSNAAKAASGSSRKKGPTP